ncbi:MAG: hypothetical protein LBF43_00375 [Puniceicoccales bacterium]|nr:hypothetical protein [Puniceicoccales bacterium]
MAVIMGAISLNAWWCPDCQEKHDDLFCPQTHKDKNGFAPSECQQVGALPDGVFVHDTPYGLRTPNGQVVHQVGEGHFLYKLSTSFETPIYYDGINNAYNENGEAYAVVGTTVDSNLVFLYENKPIKPLLFTVCANKCRTIIQTKDNHFAYAEPRYQTVENPTDVYFTGFEYVDLEGNAYERHDLKTCEDPRH